MCERSVLVKVEQYSMPRFSRSLLIISWHECVCKGTLHVRCSVMRTSDGPFHLTKENRAARLTRLWLAFI